MVIIQERKVIHKTSCRMLLSIVLFCFFSLRSLSLLPLSWRPDKAEEKFLGSIFVANAHSLSLWEHSSITTALPLPEEMCLH